jgi:hypothetical protein
VEAMLYSGNIFRVNPSRGLTMLSPRLREKMRNIIQVLRCRGDAYHSDFRMDTEAWKGAFTGIKRLSIIAEQPTRPPRSWYFAVSKKRLAEWEAWLTGILRHLNNTVPDTADVVVDANNEEFTVPIVEAVMPGRCEYARLADGDYVFGRGTIQQSRHIGTTSPCRQPTA